MLYGLERLPAGKRKLNLSVEIERMFVEDFPDRSILFDEQAARLYAKIVQQRDVVGRPIAELDAMIVAIARSRHAAVATRNTRDFDGCGVRVINPWVE